MPDILIRGTEMPKGCKSCKLSSDSHCNATGQWLFSTDLLRSGFNWKTCRLENCPLYELPPHGDLVDATQYRDEFMDGVYNMCADDSDNNRANAIIDLYDCAPVIVPADKEAIDAD